MSKLEAIERALKIAKEQLEIILNEATQDLTWHMTKGMKVACTLRLPISFAVKLEREIRIALTEINSLVSNIK